MKYQSQESQSRQVEREIHAPVDMCLEDGRLNPEAVGWSRRPLHRVNLRGWGRNKRFEYWCVITPDFLVTANISHHDYRVNLASTFVNLKTKQVVPNRKNRWLPPKGILGDADLRRPMAASAQDIAVELTPNATGTHLSVRSPRLILDVQVTEDPDHESMGVLVPWSDRLFQYTRKDNCLPAEGAVIVDGVLLQIRPDASYAIHDHGRGRWPYNTWWNWAAASGDTDGHRIGLQFGGKWTVDTPSTENCVRIDNRLHKISDELEWIYDRSDWMKPWTIRGRRVDLTFTPVIHHHHDFNKWIVSAKADQCFGTFDGWILSDDERAYPVRSVFGLAEEVHRKW